ncbi:MAG: signal peptidase I [Alphaproteobacteria bacterium]|nr:signal peptidase I [Alphaproteobacteria bacterium]
MKNPREKNSIGETIKTVACAVLIAMVIRTFAYEPFNIPSESMLPTLLVGDYLFVSKYPYGYSRHSLPWSLPLIQGRLFESQPKRGDIAVFKLPSDNSTDYIKRIVGLPGDQVQMRDGVLYINGARVPKQRSDDYIYVNYSGHRYYVPRFVETLPGGRKHETIDLKQQDEHDNTREFLVPPDHYFAMGDNRDNSSDSRVAGGVGMIPAANLVGRAEFLFFSTNGSARWWEIWRWPFAIRYDRLFTRLSQ